MRISCPAKNHSFAVYAGVSTSVTISYQAGLTCITPLLGGPAFSLSSFARVCGRCLLRTSALRRSQKFAQSVPVSYTSACSKHSSRYSRSSLGMCFRILKPVSAHKDIAKKIGHLTVKEVGRGSAGEKGRRGPDARSLVRPAVQLSPQPEG